MVLSMIFLFIQLGFAIFIFFLLIAFATGAPFVPSSNKAASQMIELAKIKPGQIIYDLGSGNGKLILIAAQKGAIATGIEINPFLVLLTKTRILLSPNRSRLKAKWGNFWSTKLSDADVVFVYLLPWRMESLEKMLINQLKPGALIVSNSFIFPHLKMIAQDKSAHVYVFSVDKNSIRA